MRNTEPLSAPRAALHPVRPVGESIDFQSARRFIENRVLAALIRALQRQRTRRELYELDERLLRDIGVSRAEALREAAKPFWKR